MSKGTTARNIRVPDDRWDAMRAAAAANGTNISAVTNRLYDEYLAAHAEDRRSGLTGP